MNKPIIFKNKRTAVVAGAMDGTTSTMYAGVFDKVYAFEPSPALFKALCKKPNRKIIYLQAALGHRRRSMAFRERAGRQYQLVADCGPVLQIKLDDLDLVNLDLLYVNASGFEFNVLKGAEKAIEMFKPVIYVYENEKQLSFNGVKKNEINNFLSKYGYTQVPQHKSSLNIYHVEGQV